MTWIWGKDTYGGIRVDRDKRDIRGEQGWKYSEGIINMYKIINQKNLMKFIKKTLIGHDDLLMITALKRQTQVSLIIWIVNMDQWVLVQWKSLPQQGKNWSRKSPLSTIGTHMCVHTCACICMLIHLSIYTYVNIYNIHITPQKYNFGGNCTKEIRVNRTIEITFVLIWSRLW